MKRGEERKRERGGRELDRGRERRREIWRQREVEKLND